MAEVRDPYRDPLPRETPAAFRLFRAWLAAGAPEFRPFADAQGRSFDAVRHMARRNRWRQRLAAKVLHDVTETEETGVLAADRAAVQGLAYRTARETLRRCRHQRAHLQEQMAEEEWAFSGAVRAATESITSEELRAVKILREAERLAGGGSGGPAGGDRTGQHGPAHASSDEVEEPAPVQHESPDDLLAQLSGDAVQ